MWHLGKDETSLPAALKKGTSARFEGRLFPAPEVTGCVAGEKPRHGLKPCPAGGTRMTPMSLLKDHIPPEQTLSRLSLLIVEDDPVTLLLLQKQLTPFMKTVLSATDGSEGLKVFRESHPDMILADINMPVLDGLSMAAIIKAEAPDTPIIALTAHNEEKILQKAIEVGMDGYIVKPVDIDILMPVLFKNARHVLHRKQEAARAQLFSYLLDINPHFIISTVSGMIDYANKTFLHFLGHETLESLLSGKSCSLNEVHVNGTRYPLCDFSWIPRLRGLPEIQHTACFSPPGAGCSAENFFWVTSRYFPELDRDIVTFTDITALERERVQLLYRATTDSLTGVSNRSKLTDYIHTEHARFRRYNVPMSLIMFDIDHFKAINDTLGHAVGDQVLTALATVVLHGMRDTDILGRWGGEEFMILAPLTILADAREFSERLRETVAASPMPGVPQLTCSFGVAEIRKGESLDSLLNRVDAALYRAKNNGRNRVETA
jgi:two-component system, cell cycle response regulator